MFTSRSLSRAALNFQSYRILPWLDKPRSGSVCSSLTGHFPASKEPESTQTATRWSVKIAVCRSTVPYRRLWCDVGSWKPFQTIRLSGSWLGQRTHRSFPLHDIRPSLHMSAHPLHHSAHSGSCPSSSSEARVYSPQRQSLAKPFGDVSCG